MLQLTAIAIRVRRYSPDPFSLYLYNNEWNMKILFIHKHLWHVDVLRNGLAALAEQDSIHFCQSYENAEAFINNGTIGEQDHLDLNICENNIDGLSAVEFYNRITKDTDRTFSDGNFYFHTIPVVLIVDEGENNQAFRAHGFADVLNNIALENLYLYSYEPASVIKEWRRRLFGDLSNIGIPFERGQLQYHYTLPERKRQGRYTRILSDAYKTAPSRLLYDWIVNDERQFAIAIGKLEKEMKRARRLGIRDEKCFSDLLDQYPALIKRDNFSTHWHESVLRRDGNESYRLDFTLKPNFSQLADLSVLELKLPQDRIIVSRNFHPTFSKPLVQNLSQVNDYRRYMKDGKNFREIKDAFDFVPQKVDYTILVGHQEEKEEYLETFNLRNQDFNAGGTHITTYDEFVQTDIDYLARRDLLSIF